MKKYWIVVIGIIGLGIIAQQVLQRTGSGFPQTTPRPGAPEERITVKPDTASWQTYENIKLGFSVQFPANATVRGTADSDLAIVTLDRQETDDKQALITITKKKIPLGQESFATMEAFWESEKEFIAASGGVTDNERYVEVNDRSFFEAREDNRQINYMGLHRYIKQGEVYYEASLAVEGEKLLATAVDRFNEIVSVLEIR